MQAIMGTYVLHEHTFPCQVQFEREADLERTRRASRREVRRNTPTAAVCCNACRTCLTTNLIGIATAGLAAAGYRIARLARRTS